MVSFAACDARLMASCAVLARAARRVGRALGRAHEVLGRLGRAVDRRVGHGLRVVDHAVARVAHQFLLPARFRKRQADRRADRHRDGADRQRVLLHPVLQL